MAEEYETSASGMVVIHWGGGRDKILQAVTSGEREDFSEGECQRLRHSSGKKRSGIFF